MYDRHYDHPAERIKGSVIGGIAVAQQQSQLGETSAGRLQPQLAMTAERLHLCVAELRSAMGALSARLDPVLNPDIRNKATVAERVPEPTRAPLAALIDSRSDELCEITNELRSLLDRLAC